MSIPTTSHEKRIMIRAESEDEERRDGSTNLLCCSYRCFLLTTAERGSACCKLMSHPLLSLPTLLLL